MRLSTVVLDASDVHELADFYRRLLDWTVVADEPQWVLLHPPGGGTGISVQYEPHYERPTWPGKPGEHGMMLHLDIEVQDLAAGSAHAEACGAVLADFQPQEHVRVYLDPAGHPFCLWVQD